MYRDPLLKRRRSGEAWRLVVLLAMVIGAVAGLVICTQGLKEPGRDFKVATSRGVMLPREGGEPASLRAESPVAFRRPRPLRSVRKRSSRYSRGIWRRVEAMEDDLQKLRRKLHRRPELATREQRTAALVAETLERLGAEVQTGVAGTGVVGLIRGARSGSVVAVRAAMDGVAVPERTGLPYASKRKARFMGRVVSVSHAAGHDVEMAVLLGVAEIIADLRDELPGAVKLIFQPASVGLPPGVQGGARAMIQAGVLAAPSVSALFALKVQPSLHVAEIAVDTSAGGGGVVPFDIELRSPSRGACRQAGPRCPDLISAAAQLVLSLRNLPHTRMAASGRLLITVGSIHAGRTGQMLPSKLTIRGSIRWRRVVDRNTAKHLIRRTTRATAALAGARARVRFRRGGALIGNNPRLARWALGTAVRVLRRRGIHIQAVPPVTDSGFDRFRRRVPSVLIQLGVTAKGKKPTPIRSPRFQVEEEAIGVGVNLMANLLVDYLLERGPVSVRWLAPAPAPAPSSARSSR